MTAARGAGAGCVRVEFDPAAGAGVLLMVRDRVRAWLTAQGLGQLAVQEMLIAVGEATANAFEHSGAQAQPGVPACWVEAWAEQGRVRVLVADRGRWLDRPVDEQRNRGRGRAIITELVDEVHVDTGDAGTSIELIKYLR